MTHCSFIELPTFEVAEVIKSVYIEKSNGDKTVPWGVPVLVVMRLGQSESNLVYWVRSVKKLEIHEVTLGPSVSGFQLTWPHISY